MPYTDPVDWPQVGAGGGAGDSEAEKKFQRLLKVYPLLPFSTLIADLVVQAFVATMRLSGQMEALKEGDPEQVTALLDVLTSSVVRVVLAALADTQNIRVPAHPTEESES